MADVRRSAFGAQTADRKFEIASGKTFSTNQIVTGKNFASNQAYVSSSTRSSDTASHRVKLKTSSKGWSFNDPEMKRRKRVAAYKVYSMEGKMKASFRKGIRWIKVKCSDLVHGW
ncbi:uncharacterized protein [Aristolochia californica]|uniref:uncharacterized protein n=1 Tax=Aristolochia californica TaxID=171875 RepID=UPI0035E01F9D